MPRTYVYCAAKTAPDSFAEAATRVRDAPAWRYRELPTGHDAMVTLPRQTADLLLEAATRP